MLVDFERELLNFVEVWIELKLEMFVFLRNQIFFLGFRFPRFNVLTILLLLWVDSPIL